MTNVEALKEVYVAYGGNAEDVVDITTNAGMIAALAEIVTDESE